MVSTEANIPGSNSGSLAPDGPTGSGQSLETGVNAHQPSAPPAHLSIVLPTATTSTDDSQNPIPTTSEIEPQSPAPPVDRPQGPVASHTPAAIDPVPFRFFAASSDLEQAMVVAKAHTRKVAALPPVQDGKKRDPLTAGKCSLSLFVGPRSPI